MTTYGSYEPEDHLFFRTNDVAANDPYIPYWLQGYQFTDTESHPEWNKRDKRVFHGDLGGPFHTRKYNWHSDNTHADFSHMVRSEFNTAYPNGRYWTEARYQGPYFPMAPSRMDWPILPEPDYNRLDEFGATAIARCSPSNPAADLTTTVGEFLGEGIPALIGGTLQKWRGLSDRDRRKAIGEEYLNLEFGWKPLINDLLAISKAIVTADLIFNQYRRDSGRLVRRSYDFPDDVHHDIKQVDSDTSPYWSPGNSLLLDVPNINKGKVYREETLTVRRWFRGAFTYYVPPADSLRNAMALAAIQARKVLGLSLTPDTVWNLAPWSWAIDWFSNSGDVLSNWTDWAIDNQVLAYGYMMEHSLQTYTWTFLGPNGIWGAGNPYPFTKTCEVRVRRKATPYGFGLTWDDFSARQKAIIAALGLSRSR